jgi:cold shock CspA family protein
MDMASGKPTTVFEGLSINTGPRFFLIAVKGNQVLNRVRVAHQAIYGGERVAVGESLLVGGITMTPEGAVATLAWPFHAPNGGNGHHAGNPHPLPQRRPLPTRHVGTVSRIHPSGKFGEILEDRTGHRLFAHVSQFANSAQMTAGYRVNYVAAATTRGPAALDIKPN